MRRAGAPARGLYSLPGGRVEFGESLHTALHREVAEETALKIEIIGLAGWREVLPGTRGGGHYLIMSFAARWSSGEPVLNEELDDFRWLAPDALGDLDLTAACPRSSGRLGACSGPRRRLGLASSALKRHITGRPGPPHVKAISGRNHRRSRRAFPGPHGPKDAAAPFDGDLQRLAEILGTLHSPGHLRQQ